MNESHIPSPFLLSTLADINVEEGNKTAASNVSSAGTTELSTNVRHILIQIKNKISKILEVQMYLKPDSKTLNLELLEY